MLQKIHPIDYLLIGHVTEDLLPDGQTRVGGTVSFSGLTAHALGHQVGVVTSCRPDTRLDALNQLQIHALPAAETTTFRNIPSETGRQQFMYRRAELLSEVSIPENFRQAAIVHLGPVADEIDSELHKIFPDSMICLTPQGWLRGFEEDGRVKPVGWRYSHDILKASHAAVLSLEDVNGEEDLIDEFAAFCKVLVVTENKYGARVYWNGDVHRFPAPSVDLVDDTGSGDIFAACFFHRYIATRDPWEAARFAVELASLSVTRTYFDSIPARKEIESAKTQIL